MKKLLFAVVLLSAILSYAVPPKMPFTIEPLIPRKINVDWDSSKQFLLTANNFDIVECQNTPTVKLAAQEIADILSEAFELPVKPVAKGSGKKYEIRVGDAELAASLGIAPESFDRDGFVIKTSGNKILIIGRDLPNSRPRSQINSTGIKGEWGTLFGAYDFLERFVGVRYYFPGKLGTYIPKLNRSAEGLELAIPDIDIYDRPDFLQRRFNDYNHGRRPIRRFAGWDGSLNKLRNRMETVYIPNCHGLANLGFYFRFGETHPEYFALNVNGKRMISWKEPDRDTSQICYSSGIKEEIIQDAISFLKNEAPSVRGIKNSRGQVSWNGIHNPGMPCFNIMPNDSAYLCHCPECWKHFSQGPQATTDYFWQFFIDICDEVKKTGLPGYLTTMAYADYRRIPTQKIPDNLLVMLAIRGPWNEYLPDTQERDMELLKAWKEKLGQKTWLWTYPGKYGGNMPGIPHTTPRAISSFIKRARPYIFGLYIECETDVLIHNYLTYHVFGKLAWDPSTDVEKLLDEHVKNLYGPAAQPMKNFFDSIERHWSQIASNVVETSEGPKTIYPSELVLWSEIYSPEEMKRLNGLFDQAERLATQDKIVLERLRFVLTEFMEPLEAEAEKFRKVNDAARAWRFPMAEFKGEASPTDDDWAGVDGFYLAGLKGTPVEVTTIAKAMVDANNFYFRFDCEETEIEKMQVSKRPFDQKEIWKDSDVELFLSPDGDRQHYYQLMINPMGSLSDLEVNGGAEDFKWNSNAKIAVKNIDGKGWQADIVLPRSSMRKAASDGVLVDFTRHRVLNETKVGTPYYCWSPFARSFGDVSRFGKLLFKPEETKNLLLNPDFIPEKIKGTWHISKGNLDKSFFLTEGSAVRLNCGDTVNSTLVQYFKDVKPDTDYEVSFFVRMDEVKKLEGKWSGFYIRFDYSNGSCMYFPAAPVQMDGTCPWTGFSFKVHTPKDFNANQKAYINFVLRKATGTVWIDHVSLVEIPAPDGETSSK